MDFIEGSATQIPMPDNSVDYSWARFFFEYLKELAEVEQEMSRTVTMRAEDTHRKTSG